MEKNYSDMVKKLVARYYEHEISFDDYQASRKKLIDQMDVEFNGNEFSNKRALVQAPQDQDS
jgi:hypothetical protein